VAQFEFEMGGSFLLSGVLRKILHFSVSTLPKILFYCPPPCPILLISPAISCIWKICFAATLIGDIHGTERALSRLALPFPLGKRSPKYGI
jgi:hypothetical protein